MISAQNPGFSAQSPVFSGSSPGQYFLRVLISISPGHVLPNTCSPVQIHAQPIFSYITLITLAFYIYTYAHRWPQISSERWILRNFLRLKKNSRFKEKVPIQCFLVDLCLFGVEDCTVVWRAATPELFDQTLGPWTASELHSSRKHSCPKSFNWTMVETSWIQFTVLLGPGRSVPLQYQPIRMEPGSQNHFFLSADLPWSVSYTHLTLPTKLEV